MKNYFTRKKLDKTITSLSDKKAALRKELRDVCQELEECYKKQLKMEQIESVKIRFGDLLDELKQITDSDITLIDLKLCSMFHSECISLEELDDKMRFFGSDLDINFVNDEDFLRYSRLFIFDSIEDMQADGKALSEHCSFYPVFEDDALGHMVVDKNIEDVICHVKIKGNHSIFESSISDKNYLLEQAIYSLIDKNKVLDIEYTKEKEQGKQKKLIR